MAAQNIKLNGRDVEVHVVTFGDIMDANNLREEKGNQHSVWHVLVCAAHYVDTGEKVFNTIEDVMRLPATEANAIMKLSSAAAALNLPAVETDKANPT